jgi:hypothetical protein
MERVRMSRELAQNMVIAGFRFLKPFGLMMADGYLEEAMGFCRKVLRL